MSSTVLVLNLPLTGTAAAVALTSGAAGEPLWLTARSLRGQWAPDPSLAKVRVCENPSIVEAAANVHGAASQPLICIYGRRSAAAWMLLRGLAAAGATLLVTADRDAAGRQFTTELLTLPGAEPWLASAEGQYEEARLHLLVADLAPAQSGVGSAG